MVLNFKHFFLSLPFRFPRTYLSAPDLDLQRKNLSKCFGFSRCWHYFQNDWQPKYATHIEIIGEWFNLNYIDAKVIKRMHF